MNPLVKKEIRLLLPSWLAVLLLEAVQPWVWNDPDFTFKMMVVIFFFGINILAVDSFGREFSLGTFPSLLAQPVERCKFWRTKIIVLFSAASIIFAAYFASCELRERQSLHDPRTFSNFVSAWINNPTLTKGDFRNAMLDSGVAMFLALVGGLWTTLMLRQIAAAFWITFLVPGAFLVLLMLCLPTKLIANETLFFTLLYAVAGVYIVAGYWLAHRLFHRAQDVAWTGGIISFSTWRYFEAGSKSSVSTRHRNPFRALLYKEFQLQSVTFFCATALLLLHLGVFLLRIFYVDHHKNSIADLVSELFWMLWSVLPMVIGGTAVVEERKLGVAESQFSLPVSRPALFTVKFIPTMILGVVLGGVMPLLLENAAAYFGAPSEMFKAQHRTDVYFFSGKTTFELVILSVAAGLTLVAFFASSFARNFLQALSITIVILIGCCLSVPLISYISWRGFVVDGIQLWPGTLMTIIAIPTLSITFLWLVYRNFSYFLERGRLWRRNCIGIAGALLFVFASGNLIYNRAWEALQPAEPAHGLAKFSLANPPALHSDHYDKVLVHLTDGRVSLEFLRFSTYVHDDNRLKRLWQYLLDPLPSSAGAPRFITGSNWLSAAVRREDFGATNAAGVFDHRTDFWDIIGVQTDGTLWISDSSRNGTWPGDKLYRFGDETNWQQVATANYRVLLLKSIGTLWRCGASNNFDVSQWRPDWPISHSYLPQKIGLDSDWSEIAGNSWINFARKTDGHIWRVGVNYKNGKEEFHREKSLDQASLKTLSLSGSGERAYVGSDGTLWISMLLTSRGSENVYSGFVRVGTETNWVGVVLNWHNMVALKSDGTLWQWQAGTLNQGEYSEEQIKAVAHTPPVRLGIHNDWVAIAGTWDDAIALAADGSLWLWPNRHAYEQDLIRLPKQPKFLGNIFVKSD